MLSFQVKQEVFSVNSYKLLYLLQSCSYCDKISVSVRLLAVVYQTHIWTVSNINSNNVGAEPWWWCLGSGRSRDQEWATISSHQPNQPALSPDPQRRLTSSIQSSPDYTVQTITEIIISLLSQVISSEAEKTRDTKTSLSSRLAFWVTGECISILINISLKL